MGSIGFNEISRQHRRAEIAFDLDDAYWGCGIMTRACAAVSAWGMESEGFVRIQATILDSNTRSSRVVEKCEYFEEGVLRSYRIVSGKPRNFRLFSLVRGVGKSRRQVCIESTDRPKG